MTIKEAREELRSYKRLLEIRQNRANEVEKHREQLYKCKVSKYGSNGAAGHNPYRLEEIIDKITKAEARYVQAIADTVEAMENIENKIERMTERHYTILHKKYIQCKSYELIAVEEHYDYFSVCRIENQGVQKYANL